MTAQGVIVVISFQLTHHPRLSPMPRLGPSMSIVPHCLPLDVKFLPACSPWFFFFFLFSARFDWDVRELPAIFSSS